MATPILYGTIASPPTRAVLIAARALNLKVDLREINLRKREQLAENFRKINPQHTIPTLDDNGAIIWDSHAIMCYLVGKYGKNDALYPKDLRKRALVDQRLHFDSGNLFAPLRTIIVPFFLHTQNSISEEKIAQVKDSYHFMNKFLGETKWLAGDSYTLADISCASSVGGLKSLVPIDSYPNVVRWIKDCETELPQYAEFTESGNESLLGPLKALLKSSS